MTWHVLKLGGELLKDPSLLAQSIGPLLHRLQQSGRSVLIVHGGGPQVSALSARLGLEVKQVAGRRVTDDATLEAALFGMAGQASSQMALACRLGGIQALSTSGVSGLVRARRIGPTNFGTDAQAVDLGWVGEVVDVNRPMFDALARASIVVTLASLAADDSGNILNINADSFAAALALKLGAVQVDLVSQVPGVLDTRLESRPRFVQLTLAEATQLIQVGVINGGMIPKVQEAGALVEHGIETVRIVDLAGLSHREGGTSLRKV